MLTSWFTMAALAQANPQNRYLINLPETWKGKPKLLLKLTEIIDTHVWELVGKEEVLEGTANYEVQFFVSPAIAKYMYYHPGTNLEFSTAYSFEAYMDVLEKGKLLHRLILNDTSVTHTKRYKFNSRNIDLPPVQNSIEYIKQNIQTPISAGITDFKITNLGYQLQNIPGITAPFDGDQFIRRNRGALTPTEKDLWDKVAGVLLGFKSKE